MKKALIQFAGITITVIITFSLIQYMGLMLDPAWSKDGFDAINAFHSLDDNSLDVIVYGSSHAWKGCDTRVMRDKYNIKAYNYGCNWQQMNTIELFLRDSLRTQSPKVVCIETLTVNQILQDTDLQGEIYYTKPMKDFDGKKEYLRQCFGNNIERYASYYFPLIMFHENWNIITYENFLIEGYERFIKNAGFWDTDNIYQTPLPDYATFDQYPISDNSIKTLDEIVSICQKNNIHIIFYTCPWIGKNFYSEALTEYAKKNNCTYLDLFQYYDELGLDGNTDFQDPDHLNTNGARKVADFLGKYIIEHYDL